MLVHYLVNAFSASCTWNRWPSALLHQETQEFIPPHLWSWAQFKGVRGVPVPPLFGLRGIIPQLFRTKRWRIHCNLLSTEAICWVKITIKPFSAPLGELMTLSQTHQSDEEGYFLHILLSSRLGTQRCFVLLLNWYPHFWDQSYAPACGIQISQIWTQSIWVIMQHLINETKICSVDERRVIDVWCGLEQLTINMAMVLTTGIEDFERASIRKEDNSNTTCEFTILIL